ncbi:hypothetical protein G7061_09285 [Erysipelothrix sp. HDW6B]|uniref:hypothetical protein n=1 Tax=Erysipelothrix sp. HDW6B TaxID=2714929 RepID=UPI0014098D70|nr:hypothetical protein [Erysipelothrix sp. HDW6B]QIK86793.1 hypothetical protein G7061_09285 [Erysipelothrix sp. HDW6B]
MKEMIQDIMKKKSNVSLNGSTYISPKNICGLLDIIEENKTVPSILITPYLINVEDLRVYELHDYEFDIDVTEGETIVLKYNKNNSLPDELTKRINPGIRVSKDNYSFAINELRKYLDAMETMTFNDVTNTYSFLTKENLYYQIF